MMYCIYSSIPCNEYIFFAIRGDHFKPLHKRKLNDIKYTLIHNYISIKLILCAPDMKSYLFPKSIFMYCETIFSICDLARTPCIRSIFRIRNTACIYQTVYWHYNIFNIRQFLFKDHFYVYHTRFKSFMKNFSLIIFL